MVRDSWLRRVVLSCGTVASLGAIAVAQAPQGQPAPRASREALPRPVYRVAQQQAGGPAATVAAANTNTPPGPNPATQAAPQKQHPLVPAIQAAYGALNTLQGIKDYSATMIKQERINGKLNDPEFMYVKIRHEPFSVYMYFLGPPSIRGQEALYVEGKNNGNLLGHGVGIKKIAGTVPLQPTGAMAMAGQRYPITEIGILNLTKRLIEVGEQDMKYGECEVKFYTGAKINDRVCTCVQVIHPFPRKNFKFYEARIFLDDKLNIPIRYESYDWPEKPGGKPQLLESYTYTDIKLNNGFTDLDFDADNPKYGFK